ncbi:hypothetical protein CDO87_03575 [Sagittula sp. P11]|uniref:hypothetical protein n=1 Tax=Sagittula sp. P11 TaxID=2009329 RepID=UPI000C2CF050|nr:hypothetical protein [Sagittula sp. P11]AUC52324.1 hypothetical protein CDO87_03575 [Sagittula sp. P11]
MTVGFEHYVTGNAIARALLGDTEEAAQMIEELARRTDADWIADVVDWMILDNEATEEAKAALASLFELLRPVE